MKTVLHKESERGRADHGWLKANFSFSFSGYHNPSRMHFGMLRVLNDDYIAPGMGFGRHPHDNMEIVTIPQEGSLKHQDSTGGEGIIQKGEVQIMSAGTGIFHSEMNASSTEAAKVFQCWVFPKEQNIKPRYDQRMFEKEKRMNRFCTVVSPDQEDAEKDGTLWINQDAFFSLGIFNQDQEVSYAMKQSGNGVYVMLVEGEVEIGGQKLNRRDAIGVWETEAVPMKLTAGTELLLIEVPMN
jgi:quercetin 2,3-dioxygenase